MLPQSKHKLKRMIQSPNSPLAAQRRAVCVRLNGLTDSTLSVGLVGGLGDSAVPRNSTDVTNMMLKGCLSLVILAP